MTSPKEVKSLKVSPETHRRVMDLAARERRTVDEMLCQLMGEGTVRVPVTRVQRARWSQAADRLGVSLEGFVSLSVENSMASAATATLAHRTHFYVRALAAYHGLNVTSTLEPRAPESTEGDTPCSPSTP